MAYIEIDNLKYRYPKTKKLALDGISLQIEKGSFLGVIGRNGAGKSTLSSAIIGLVPQFYKGAYGGSVIVDGLDASRTPVSELSRKVGLVFQNPFNQLSGAKDTVYDPKIVEATFNNLKGLTGVRSDLSISIVDRLNAVANFQFASTRSLYQCFNLLRAMSEASRKPIEEFQREIVKLSSQTTRDETPFSSIEVELEACTHSPEVVEAQNQESEIPVPEGDDETQMVAFVGPVKGFFDYCNHLHFDIHVKLRMLFIISAAAFCMKYIPFVPLVALLVVAYMLRAGWLKIEEDSGVTEPKTESEANKGFNSVRNFVLDYLAWQNIEKSSLVLKVASAIFLGWIILPGKAYTLDCIIAYIVFVAWPIYQSDLLQKIVAGFWFCT